MFNKRTCCSLGVLPIMKTSIDLVIYIHMYAVCVTHRSCFYLLLVTYFSTTEVQISWSFSINNARGLDLLTPLTLICKPSRMIFFLLKVLLLHASRWLTATVSDHILLEWFDRSGGHCSCKISMWATNPVPIILKRRSTASAQLSTYAQWLQTHRQLPSTGNDSYCSLLHSAKPSP